MKVLFINNFFSPYGGTETTMYDQANILRKNGHEVFFFATNKKPYFEETYPYSNIFPEYTDYRKLSKLNIPKYIFKPFYNIEARDKLDIFLDVIKPDIVHIHNIYYHLTPSVIEPCKNKNIPVVMTLNDTRMMCPSGTLMYKGETYCDNELCLSGNVFHCLLNKCKDKSLKASLIATAENLYNKTSSYYNLIDIFLCPSDAMRNLAINFGISLDKLAILSSFVNDSFLEATPSYTDKGYFFYIGRLTREKGVHYLIEAMAELPEIQLHIAGSGPEEQNLKELAKSLNLTNIKFLGFLSNESIAEGYRNCIATILPCHWFETFGLTNIESFAYGKPVIASRIGAIPEIVENNINGIVFEPGNISELASAIKKLHSDRELVIEMGKRNREKVVKLYSIDTHYKNLINIYNSALS